MKLYATITSERASKGQGGNEFIESIITIDEGKRKAVHIQVWIEKEKIFLKYNDCMGNELYEDLSLNDNTLLINKRQKEKRR